jgi:hypothetical protein
MISLLGMAARRLYAAPADEKIVAPAEELLEQFDAVFGLRPGFRPIHARKRSAERRPRNRKRTSSIRFRESTGSGPADDLCSNVDLRAAIYPLSGRRRGQAEG